MKTELRTLRRSEWDSWFDGILRAFGAAGGLDRELYRELTETDRSLGAWDGDELVGSASLFSFRMAVPGGALVPSAGLAMVHVSPTHRRRGILRSMMRRQLDETRDAGVEPLSLLTASEPGIYGRFGYGMATRRLDADIDTARVTLKTPPGSDRLRMRLADDAASVSDACESVYARRVPERPGMLERAPGWERMPLTDPPEKRKGAGALACVLAEDEAGEVRGYARYALRHGSDGTGVARGTVLLRDMEALDTAAYGAVWRYLFDLDLMTDLRVRDRPVDDAWLHMVGDSVRLCRPRWRDSLFARPVEVGAALAARTYTAPVDVVIDVEDAFCPWNEGRWRLSGDAGGARCERTRDAADLALSVRELGAAYLGGTALRALGSAGRVRELRPGALGAASAAFATDQAPWLSHGF
ncbi:GNAT family N-acetyltransferase [Streptomyces sp. WMMB 322]|uniref:GNAT family N-acetyltransferase n=1 Tax=Streptomyces sp. WMMB 322 TaxID=1286821 RepID=UPI0006E21155|nr:GNAT family N-acetyltransferase [Streptomyces sp. WMMB 322]SCK18272.1 Predicted acetyltransferase [Streptomyces sp. WMMB 322]